jgi:anti-sigma regulatory factor (Ser/Thr protein kinase)
VFDPVEAELSWVNAGHPPPLVLDADGTARFLELGRSVPLGVLPFPAYEQATATLEPGGAIVLYTDGLVERRGEHIDDGLQLLARAAEDSVLDPHVLCERLLAAAVPDGATSDDVALLTLCHAPLGDRLVLELPSAAPSLRALRAHLRRWLAQAHAADADVHAVVMACSEACTNAIEHAGAQPHETVSFEAVIAGDDVEATITDRGRWRDQRPPSDQGRGLELIDALMDEVHVDARPTGTTVRLRRRLTARVSA